jgi:hypothetical protein
MPVIACLTSPWCCALQLSKKGWFESRPAPAWCSDPRAYEALQTTLAARSSSEGIPFVTGEQFSGLLHGCASVLEHWSSEPAGMSPVSANELAALLGCLTRVKLGCIRRAWASGRIVGPVRSVLSAAISCQVPSVRTKLLEAAFRIIRASPASKAASGSSDLGVTDRTGLLQALKATPPAAASAAAATSSAAAGLIADVAAAVAKMPAKTFKSHARSYVQTLQDQFGASECVTVEAAQVMQSAAKEAAPPRGLKLNIGLRSVVLAVDSDCHDCLLAVWGQDVTLRLPRGKDQHVVAELHAPGYTCATVGELAEMRPPCPRIRLRLRMMPHERLRLERFLRANWTVHPDGRIVCPFTCPSWPAEPRVQRSPSPARERRPTSAVVANETPTAHAVSPAPQAAAVAGSGSGKRGLAAFSQADSPERPSGVVAGFASSSKASKTGQRAAPLTHAAAFVVTRDELRQRLGVAGLVPSRPLPKQPAESSSPPSEDPVEALPAGQEDPEPESAVRPRRIRFHGHPRGAAAQRSSVALLCVPRRARPHPLLLESLSIDVDEPENQASQAISPLAKPADESPPPGAAASADDSAVGKEDGNLATPQASIAATEQARKPQPVAPVRMGRRTGKRRRLALQQSSAARKQASPEPRRAETKAETKQAEPKQAEPKQAEPKQAEPKQAEPTTPPSKRPATIVTPAQEPQPESADSSAGRFVTVHSAQHAEGDTPAAAVSAAPARSRSSRRNRSRVAKSPPLQRPDVTVRAMATLPEAAEAASGAATEQPSPTEHTRGHPRRRASLRAAAVMAAARIAEQVVPSSSSSTQSSAESRTEATPAREEQDDEQEEEEATAAESVAARADDRDEADSREASPASPPRTASSDHAMPPSPFGQALALAGLARSPQPAHLGAAALDSFALSTPLGRAGARQSSGWRAGRELAAVLQREVELALSRVRGVQTSLEGSHAALLKHHKRAVAGLLADASSKASAKLQSVRRKSLAKCDSAARLARAALGLLKQEAEAIGRGPAVREGLSEAAQLRQRAEALRQQASALDAAAYADAVEAAVAMHAATRRKRVKRALHAANLSAASQPVARPASAQDALRSLMAFA